jgi:homospermidine synthase
VRGVHIAERDTQRAVKPKPVDVFWNTWSVDGFISEGLQPAELGWGTHERWMPDNARPCGPDSPAIFLEQPGANTRVRTWCPSHGAQYGFLVTHNEALSIPDFFTVRDADGNVTYRPTCHYAYHPCNDAVLSFHELFGAAGRWPSEQKVLDEDEIVDGRDELGVLLYGHGRNAYWYGSQLTIEEARALAPHQNATGMQVTSAVLAGIVWALENPEAGIVETDDMDHVRCLEVQLPYLGNVEGFYTDWTPLADRPGLFPDDIDPDDPWQFRNVLVH